MINFLVGAGLAAFFTAVVILLIEILRGWFSGPKD